MILGIGTDIVTISRIERLWILHGARLARHLLTEEECTQIPPDAARFIAKRFAAKEAFAKAAGTGLRAPVLLRHLTVTHDPLGQPNFAYAPVLQAWLTQRGATRTHLSLSDERDTVVAFVLLEGAT